MINQNSKNGIETTNRFNPLVSIVVITYNSSKYVLETLESAKAQTYRNIELIVSDDCSTDDTINLCRTWIAKNKDYFVRSKLIITDKNTGIPGNCNRAINKVRGEWIRGIAGDDALYSDAIKLAIDYVKLNQNVDIFTSNKAVYKSTFEEENLIEISNENLVKDENNNNFFELAPSQQFSSLLFSNKVNTVGLFYKRQLIINAGGYDERLRYLEDTPMYLKLTKNGVKIFCMNKLTVKYRIHNESVRTLNSSERALFNNFYLKIRKFRKLYIFSNISAFGRFSLNYEYYRHYIIDFLGLNKKIIIGRFIYYVTGKISPIRFKRLFLKAK